MRRQQCLALVAFAIAVLVASTSFAGKFNKVLDIGDKGPNFQSLAGTDGKEHSLADYEEAEAIVLIFTCNHCPVAVACEDRVIELQRDYKDKKVQVIAVNVNNSEGDRLDKMVERAQQRGFNFPYLYDPSQKIAKDYGAQVTPDVVLLDKNRNVVYTGLIDDEPLAPASVTKHHLRDAIDAVLAGNTPALAETKAKGCGIQWDRR